jgi:hypothetical protein
MVSHMTKLTPDQLYRVMGAEAVLAPVSTIGRCGPSDAWSFLGDIRTQECVDHDMAVRRELTKGSSALVAHAKALPGLPAAIGSYVRARLNLPQTAALGE